MNESTREDDERDARVLLLAGAGWGLAAIAVDTELDPVAVIETLYTHRDCFDPFAEAPLN